MHIKKIKKNSNLKLAEKILYHRRLSLRASIVFVVSSSSRIHPIGTSPSCLTAHSVRWNDKLFAILAFGNAASSFL